MSNVAGYLSPAEVAALAQEIPDQGLPPSHVTLLGYWRDAEYVAWTMRRYGFAYRAYREEGKPVCVWSVSGGGGQTEAEAPYLRWIGHLAAVPRQDLSGAPVRLLLAPDRAEEAGHLPLRLLETQMLLAMGRPPVMPAEAALVETRERPTDEDIAFWEALLLEHEQRRGSGDSPETVRAEAHRQAANPGWRWYGIPEIGAAKAGAIGETETLTHVALAGNYVRPEYRGNGFGRALIAARLMDGYRRGLRGAVAMVAPWNEESQGALETVGFAAAANVYLLP